MAIGKKQFITLLVIVLSSVTTITSQAADLGPTTQDNWNYPGPASIGEREVLFYDQDSGSRPTYFLDTTTPGNIYESDPTCKSTNDSKCSLESFMFNAILPFCNNEADVNCISGMGAIDSNGNRIPGNFVQNLPKVAQNQFQGNPEWKLPSGGSGELFTIPGVNNSAGNSYFVSASVRGKGGKSLKPIVTHTSFDISITPVSIRKENYDCSNPDNCTNGGFSKFTDPNGKQVWGIFGAKWANDDKTLVEYSGSEGLSLHRTGFPTGYGFYANVRLNFSPSGWMHGRLLDPNLSIDLNKGIYNLKFEGTPVRVPIAFATAKWSSLSPTLKKSYQDGSWKCKVKNCITEFSRVGVFLDYAGDDLNNVQITETPYPSGIDGIDELNQWLPLIKNTASAVLTNWSVRTLSTRESTGMNKCFQDKDRIMGLVTTNSTEYSAGPPEFDKKNGVLNYKVASPHFEPNRYPFKGTYNLLMRNEVAKCLYGFKNAAVRADISVINEKGQTSVATTTFSQDQNWISLKAANFEFSSPTVKVKLKQK